MSKTTSISDMARAEGRYYRRIIRRDRGDVLTRAETGILVSVLNLWLHHRNGPKGFIHPGRKALAKKNKCTVVTVARSLARFRSLGLVTPTKHLTGGQGKATHYTVDLERVRSLFDPSNVVAIPGVLVPFRRRDDTVNDPSNDTVSAYQNDTLSYDGGTVVSLKSGGRLQ